MHNKNRLTIKEKSLSWQISTILVTQIIFSGIIISIISFIFLFFGIREFLDFILFKILANYLAIFVGLSFGIVSIINTKIDNNKINKISFWLALINFFWILANWRSNNIFYNIVNMAIVPFSVYFYSKYILIRQIGKIRSSFLKKIGIKKLESIIIIFYFIMYCSFLCIFIYNAISYCKTGHNYFVENIIPKSVKSKIDVISMEYRIKDIEIKDNLKINAGSSIVSQLNFFYQVGNCYPNDLSSINTFDAREILNYEIDMEIPKKEDFSYRVFNNGQNYELCVDLSVLKKCWP